MAIKFRFWSDSQTQNCFFFCEQYKGYLPVQAHSRILWCQRTIKSWGMDRSAHHLTCFLCVNRSDSQIRQVSRQSQGLLGYLQEDRLDQLGNNCKIVEIYVKLSLLKKWILFLWILRMYKCRWITHKLNKVWALCKACEWFAGIYTSMKSIKIKLISYTSSSVI